MFFTIVCSVFSCLCSFPVVRAVITQGCQLHRASVLVVCKPLSSHPSGLKAAFWFSSEEFPEAWSLGPCYLIYKILTLCVFKSAVIPNPPHLSALQDYSWYQKLDDLAVVSISFIQRCKKVSPGSERNLMIGKKNSECCNSPFFSPPACASAGTLCLVLWGQQKCSRVNIIQWFCINVHFTQSHKTTVLNVVVIHVVVSWQHAVAVLSFI